MRTAQECDDAIAQQVADTPRDPEGRRSADRHGTRFGLLADIALPLVAYYALHAIGVSDRIALTAAAVAAGVRLIAEALLRRRVTWFASIMLVTFGVGAVLTLTGGDPRTILLKDSAGTGLIGVVFLVSLIGPAPFTLAATETWRPDQAAHAARLYRGDRRVRRVFRATTLLWGAGLLGESLCASPSCTRCPST